MKKVWIALSIITVSTVIFLCVYRTAVYEACIALLDQWHLVPRHERFTELYFYNIVPLQGNSAAAETHFSFVIHNLEGKDMDYRYRIYLEHDGTSKLLETDTEHLADHTAATLSKTFHITDLEGDETIVVSLPELAQQIHFRLFPHS